MNARDYFKNGGKLTFVLNEMEKEDRDILMDAIDKMNARREFKDRKEQSRYTELHYVKVPENHVSIDFDIKDSDGNKKKGYHEIVQRSLLNNRKEVFQSVVSELEVVDQYLETGSINKYSAVLSLSSFEIILLPNRTA